MPPTLTNQTTGMTAIPNANTTPAQVAGAAAYGFAPIKANTTIDGSSLGAVTPFTPPVTNPKTDASNALSGAVAPNIPADDPNRSAAMTALFGAQNEPGKSEDTMTQESNFGVADKLSKVNALEARSMGVSKSYADKIQNIKEMNPEGQYGSAVNGEISQLERQRDSQLADIAIEKSVANSDYQGAQKLATQKVEADAEVRQNKIDALKDYITASDASPAEKAKMTIAVNAQQNASDEQKQKDLKDYQAKIDAKDPDKIANRNHLIAETNKINIENAQNSGEDNVSILDGNGNPISLPIDVAPYYGMSHSGIGYIDASSLQGTASDKKSIVNQAQKAGLKVILNKDTALDLTNIKDANSKLDTTEKLFSEVDQPNALARDLGGAGLTSLGILAQTDPKAAISQSVSIIGLDLLKGISGVQGFRGNQTAIQQVQDHLPKATDTADIVKGKVAFIRSLIDDRENAIVGKSKSSTDSSSTKTVKVNGQDWEVGTVYADAKGNKGTFDSSGKWIAQ